MQACDLRTCLSTRTRSTQIWRLRGPLRVLSLTHLVLVRGVTADYWRTSSRITRTTTRPRPQVRLVLPESRQRLRACSCCLDTTMRAGLIGDFEPCMSDIYLHIYARLTDYIRTHP